MAACADQEMLLSALLDGELDAANTALVEAHMLRCEGCREEFDRLSAVRTLLRAEGVRHTTPDLLKKRILELPELTAAAKPQRRLPGWLAPGVAGALAASLAMVTLVGPVQQQSSLDSQIISSHVRSLQPGHLTDV